MDIAFIFGASSAFGADIIEVLEKQENGTALDEIWAVSGQRAHLSAVSIASKRIRVVPIPLDLTEDMSFDFIKEMLSTGNVHIKLLVNAVSCCEHMDFYDTPAESLLKMVNLNVKASVMSEHICLPYMSAGSAVIVVGSVTTAAPLRGQSVYGAGKSFMRYHAGVLRRELRSRGINVLYLSLAQSGNEFSENVEMSAPDADADREDLTGTASKALRLAFAGKGRYTPGFFCKLVTAAGRLLPESLVVKLFGE